MTHPWPLFDLRIRTPRLELRAPTDEDLVALVEVPRAGIHEPDRMPFKVAWIQEVVATGFPTLRTVETGSWLGLVHQRHGVP